MYEQTTRGIVIRVNPEFNDDQSIPDEHRYVWSYVVEIENQSEQAVQLLTRHWIITDANGRTEEVRGAGVIGEQPTLQPGDTFRYASGAPLTTPSGLMRGAYEMRAESGDTFDAVIPAFSLDSPYEPSRVRPN